VLFAENSRTPVRGLSATVRELIHKQISETQTPDVFEGGAHLIQIMAVHIARFVLIHEYEALPAYSSQQGGVQTRPLAPNRTYLYILSV